MSRSIYKKMLFYCCSENDFTVVNTMHIMLEYLQKMAADKVAAAVA